MKLLFALLGGMAVFFFFWALLISWQQRGQSVKKRVQSLQTSTGGTQRQFSGEANAAQQRVPFYKRVVEPLAEKARACIARVTPRSFYEIAVQKTNEAGAFYRWGVDGFIAYWMSVATGSVILTLIYIASADLSFWQNAVIFFMGVAAGVYLPIFLINIRIQRRRQAILRQLPDVLDLLCVSVQAGLSFDAALRHVAAKMTGPLIEECSRMLQELRFGMVRKQALERMAERCYVQEVSLFVAAVVQADKLGVSLANVLVIQADNMREMRRQIVKKKALEAPIKMLLPLGLFIFPAMFIVTLLPALLNVLSGFKGLLGR